VVGKGPSRNYFLISYWPSESGKRRRKEQRGVDRAKILLVSPNSLDVMGIHHRILEKIGFLKPYLAGIFLPDGSKAEHESLLKIRKRKEQERSIEKLERYQVA